MSKLAALSSNPVIREYSQRIAQDTTSAIAEFIAPTVPVSTSLGFFKKYDEKSSMRIPDTRRSLGGNATSINIDASDKEYDCQHHALDFPVDMLQKIEEALLQNSMKEAAKICAQVGSISHEHRVIKLALESAGAGTALDIGNDDDLVEQVDAAIIQVLKAAKFGSLMNIGIVFGMNMWKTVKNHPSVRGRFVAGGRRDFSNPSLADFCEMLVAQAEARVSLLCYDTAPEGLPASVEFMLENDMFVFARIKEPSRYDPSFMKTFRLHDNWMVPGSYTREDGRVEVAKLDWSADVQVTNSGAVVRKTIGN
ncbi:MAG: hypothetical protein ACRCXD_03040 [Luteolibacter sp.]